MSRPADDCGPEHDGCSCEYECPDCGGLVREEDCSCTCTDNIGIADAWRCINCCQSWHHPVRAGQQVKAAERKRLAEWNAWATAS